MTTDPSTRQDAPDDTPVAADAGTPAPAKEEPVKAEAAKQDTGKADAKKDGADKESAAKEGAAKADANATGKPKDGPVVEMIKTIVYALMIALVIRVFLYQPFNIPSGSMKPTLLVGDYVFVSKFSYGYSKYSIPFSPDLFEGRIWAGEPERGDIAVFRRPDQPSVDYIKRIIGLPGDRVQVIEGVLHLNGVAVERVREGTLETTDQFGREGSLDVWRETLPSGRSYLTADDGYSRRADDTKVYVVPEGHYFAMGDNRDNSEDSRFSVGPIPAENLVGRADVIFFSLDEGAAIWELWRWPLSIRWSRLFDGLG